MKRNELIRYANCLALIVSISGQVGNPRKKRVLIEILEGEKKGKRFWVNVNKING